MTELQSALQLVTGWLEEGENLDRFAEYLFTNKRYPRQGAIREANEIFELLRDASEWQTAIDNTADWDAD